jgi:hypothetical protein
MVPKSAWKMLEGCLVRVDKLNCSGTMVESL